VIRISGGGNVRVWKGKPGISDTKSCPHPSIHSSKGVDYKRNVEEEEVLFRSWKQPKKAAIKTKKWKMLVRLFFINQREGGNKKSARREIAQLLTTKGGKGTYKNKETFETEKFVVVNRREEIQGVQLREAYTPKTREEGGGLQNEKRETGFTGGVQPLHSQSYSPSIRRGNSIINVVADNTQVRGKKRV